MKVQKQNAVRHDWDQIKTWNYKLPHLKDYQSVVYAEVKGDHGQVTTSNLQRIYYIIDGQGEFDLSGEVISVQSGDVMTIPANTKYNYRSLNDSTLKVLLIMELWDN